jgi:hypothetical protein
MLHHCQPFCIFFFFLLLFENCKVFFHFFASNVSSLLFLFTFFIVIPLNFFSFLAFVILLFCSLPFFFHQQKSICIIIIKFFVFRYYFLLLFKRCKVCLSFFCLQCFFFTLCVYYLYCCHSQLAFHSFFCKFFLGLFVVFWVLLVAFQFWIQYQKYRFCRWGNVVTLALGSRPKKGLTKVWAKNEARESHFMLMGGWEYGKLG